MIINLYSSNVSTSYRLLITLSFLMIKSSLHFSIHSFNHVTINMVKVSCKSYSLIISFNITPIQSLVHVNHMHLDVSYDTYRPLNILMFYLISTKPQCLYTFINRIKYHATLRSLYIPMNPYLFSGLY